MIHRSTFVDIVAILDEDYFAARNPAIVIKYSSTYDFKNQTCTVSEKRVSIDHMCLDNKR